LRTFFNFQPKTFALALTIAPFVLISDGSTSRAAEKYFDRDIQISTNKTAPASKEDTFLYRQIGINFVCRARLAKIDFPEALGIAAATFADIISQKHEGFVDEFPDGKLTQQQLYVSGQIQIVQGAIKYCPDQVPNDAKKKFKEIINKNNESKKEK